MKKLKITLESWDYTCGDGCCTDYGTKLYLNDKELEHPDPEQWNNNYLGDDVETSLHAVLKELGYEVEFENTYDR
jgi:hypothetical protein